MSIRIKWLQYYDVCKLYYKAHGNLLIKPDQKFLEVDIATWLNKQRKNKLVHQLSEEQIRLLDDLGFIWNKFDYNWHLKYEEAKEYYLEHNNLLVDESHSLFIWLKDQRLAKRYKKISAEREKLLNEIDMPWNVFEWSWHKYYLLCEDYYKTHGNLDLPSKYIVDGFDIGAWLRKQVYLYRKCKLTKERKELLDIFNLDWDDLTKTKEDKWMDYFIEAEKFYLQNNHLIIPRSYKVNGLNLGVWLSIQRTIKSKLSEERIKKLDSICMAWKVLDKKRLSWDEGYEIVKEYYDMHGDLNVSRDFYSKGLCIYNWLMKQHSMYNNNRLSQRQIDLLDDINYDYRSMSHKKRWLDNFELAKQFYVENHHLNVPISNLKLYRFISYQKELYASGNLSQEKIDLLNSIGIVWNKYDKMLNAQLTKRRLNRIKDSLEKILESQLQNYSEDYYFKTKDDVKRVEEEYTKKLFL